LFGASVYRGKPLFDLVDRYVTVDLLRAVAEEAAKGRLLMIATTDLDKEQTVIWNLGIIAAQGGESARRLFRDVIIASCSIPGLYPPVLIRVTQSGTLHDEMHVDGGTTSALFIAPELANLIPLDSARLEGANTFVIVNGPLGAPSQTTPLRTTSILERSIIATLHTSSLEGVELALALAQRAGMQLRITEIPNDYPYVGPLDVEPARMKALYDFGMRCAQQQQLWATAVELLDRVERARLTSAAAPTECPGPTQVQRAGD
jgi:predicted acylesterase/phospholipase RssA